MTSGQSLFIPRTPLGDAWVSAIQKAQASAPPRTSGAQRIEIYRDLDAFETDTQTNKTIIYTGISDFKKAAEINPERNAHCLDSIVSRDLCRLSQAAKSGTLVADGQRKTITIKDLGHVDITIESFIDNFKHSDNSTSLAMYRTLDIQKGDGGIWPPEIFSFSSGQSLTGGQSDIDLTGRARFLMHGPYIELPPGLWTGELFFCFDPGNSSPSLVRFDWGDGENFTQEDIELTDPGNYSMKLSHRWNVASPAQFRLLLLRPVFHGNLSVINCKVTFNNN